MLNALKSKRKRVSKDPAHSDYNVRESRLPQTPANSQNDLFSKDTSMLGNATQKLLQDDSFIDSLDLDLIEQQLKENMPDGVPATSGTPPGFSTRDKKLKYRSPIADSSSPVSKLSRIRKTPTEMSSQRKYSPPANGAKPSLSNSSQISRQSSSEKPQCKLSITELRPLPDIASPEIICRPPISTAKCHSDSSCVPSVTSTNQEKSSCHQKATTNLAEEHMTTPVRRSDSPSLFSEKNASQYKLDLSQFSSSFFLTPRGATQKQLYNTGLMSPYTSTTKETTRLGVPDEVFKLIDRIRGIKNLYPWQEATVSACLTGGNHIITCPTSGGKTLVGELLLLNAVLTRCTDALLVLPYVALVEEKVRELAEFAEHFSFGLDRYAGSRGRLPPRKRINKRTVYVATIEKANSLFNSLHEEGRCGEIGVVVVDELHMIGDGYRGAILETCLSKFLSINPGPRIIGMTATLNNHKEVSGFLKCSMAHMGGARPVVLKEHVKIEDTIHVVDKTKKELVPNRQSTPVTSPANLTSLTDKDCVAALVQEALPECVLVFCPTKASCETTARLLANVLPNNTDEVVKKKRDVLLTRIKLETGHVDSVLAEIIPSGICYHHSGLTGDERVLVEEGFCSGVLSVLCCTSTLAAGVNLPAARVIIRSVRIGKGTLTRTRYLQMVGRAGRTGLSSIGDSFLLGNLSERKILHELVFGQLEDVRSCLDKESLTLTLLHLIGSGMIKSMADLGMFVKRTLLNIQQPDESMNLAESALNFLQTAQFVERKEGVIEPTTFGTAVYKSSLDPTLSHTVLEGLRQANRHLVLLGDLHLVFLCVPPDIQNIFVDWMMYFNAYNQFDEITRLTFAAIGLQESFLARRAFTQNKSDMAAEIPYKKFYVAGALHKLISGKPVWDVSAVFKIPRGSLQSALNSAVSHASKLSHFTKELPEFWAMSAVFEALVQKLFFAGAPELSQILEIPGVKHARARQLYKAGYHTLQKLAAAQPTLLAAEIEHLSEKLAQKIISSAKILLQEQADALTDAAMQLLEVGKL